jgi:hypothetical protein
MTKGDFDESAITAIAKLYMLMIEQENLRTRLRKIDSELNEKILQRPKVGRPREDADPDFNKTMTALLTLVEKGKSEGFSAIAVCRQIIREGCKKSGAPENRTREEQWAKTLRNNLIKFRKNSQK